MSIIEPITKDSETMTESAKILATSLLYVQKEIARLGKAIDLRLDENNESVNSQIDEAMAIAVEKAITLAQPELPETLVYESHLQETKYNFDVALANIKAILDTQKEKLNEHSHTDLYAALSHSHSDLAGKDHIHEQYALSEHDHEYLAPLNHTHDSYLTVEDFVTESNKIDTRFESLISTIDQLNESLELTSASFKQNLTEDAEQWNSKVTQIDEDINNLNETITEVISTVTTKINEKLENNISFTSKLNEKIDDEVGLMQNWTEAVLEQKSDLNHIHEEYADINHHHAEMALNTDLNNLKSEVDNQYTKIQHINSILVDHEKILSGKANLDDVFLRSDLDTLMDGVKRQVIAEIPVPKDGKDADEWEFKFHAQKPHILMYKKKSESQWRHQNLVPTAVVSALEKPQNDFGVAGGLSVNDIVTSLQNLYYDETGTPVIGKYVTTFRSTTTDENGYWEIPLDNMELTTITEVVATGIMLDDAGRNLDPVERKIDYQVQSIDTTKVTGYAFLHRDVTHLAGNEDYSMDTVGAGYKVTVRVTGEVLN